MSDAPLPRDVPRLRAIERHLLLELARVRRAIAEAEDPSAGRGQIDTTRRWVIQWRWVKKGQPRRGVVHRADCWMAKGEKLDIGAVSRQRQRPGVTLEPCDVCQPPEP